MFWSSKENNGKDKDNDDDKRRAAAAQTVKIEAQKKTAKKKKEPDENPSTPSASEADFEKSKRRNSLTDSPLTELSPSSNGDSADDIGSEGMEGSKHEEMVSTNSSTSLSGVYSVNSPHKDRHTCDFPEGNFVLNETETIDAMELEYVHEILVETNKLIKQLKYNKWTDALCRTIILGDFIGFNRRFKLVMQCLKKRKPQQYGAISSQQLAAFVAQSIVERFDNSAEETTILMILLANHDQAFSCAQHGHGHCRIAHMLLKLLAKAELTRLLEAKAIRTGKTALHLAVATGNPCQLGVLLGLADLNPNTVDKSGRAPIHYAVERNSLQMVKMLMWYGADISMVQSENSKFSSLYISQCVDPNATVNHWLQERLKAVSRKTMALARELCAKHYHVQKELSGTHFIRLDGNSSLQRECQLNLHSAPNLFHVAKPHAHNQHSQPKSRAILFMIPIVFRASDEYSAASDPKIVRVFFPRDVIVSGQPILDSLTDGEHQATKLPPIVLNRFHNEAFYAFELQDSLNVGLYRLSCRLGSPALNKQQRDGIIVAVQAFLCNSLTEKGGKSKTD